MSRRTWRAAHAVTVVAAVCAVGVIEVAPAAAAPGYASSGSFGDEGGGDGQFTSPRAVAVAPNGDVLVADRDNDRVEVFTPDAGGATYAGQFGAGIVDDPSGLAVDPSDGSIYVSDADEVVKFTSGHSEDATFTHLATHGQLAVDPATDDLLVANPVTNAVERYASDGTPVASGVPAGPFSALGAIAVDHAGKVLLVDGTAVRRFTPAGQPDGTLDGLTEPNALAVNADDQVVVGDSNDSYNSSVLPAIRFYDAGATEPRASYPLPDSSGLWGQITGAAIAPGASGRLYVVSDKDQGFGVVRVFAFDAIVPVAPVVSSPAASEVSARGALLGATVNPGLAPATFHFEWGRDTSYGHVTPDRSAGDGGTDTQATEYVGGLAPETTYHFRIVVDNGVGGPVTGADQTFTTALAEPTAAAPVASAVTPTSASLSAVVDTFGQAGTYTFTVRATDRPFVRTVGPLPLAAATGARAIAASFDGLPSGATFTAEISVRTPGGAAATEPSTFATPGLPPYVPPPSPEQSQAPYGCAAPRLDAHDARVRPGAEVALTGADLGVYGNVAIGDGDAPVQSYGSGRIVVTVPAEARGTLPVRVNCGHLSNTIALVVTPPATLTLARASGKAVRVTAKVSGAGTLRLTGSSLAALTAKASKAGTYRLAPRLTKAGMAALRRRASKRLSLTARVRFTPSDGGAPITKSIAITFDRGALR